MSIAGFQREWLYDAEISFVEGGDRTGLSLYFTEESLFGDFARFVGLPDEAVEREKAFRKRLDLAPRHWIKLHYRGGRPDGFSQYFVIDPRIEYPVTSLRLMARSLGLEATDLIEPAFRRALETPGTLFAAIAKGGAPRLSTRLPRPILPEVLTDFAAAEYITGNTRDRLLEADKTIEASPWAYLSVDPQTTDAVSLDFELPRLDETPASRYLKIRPRGESWERSRYYLLADIFPPEVIWESLGAPLTRAARL